MADSAVRPSSHDVPEPAGAGARWRTVDIVVTAVLGVAFGVGFVAGPLFGGILGEYGARVPFYAAAAVSFLAFVFAFFFLPESLDRENRRPFRWREANPIGAFFVVAR
ncbi:MAG: MFS transporter, partial [Blastococcus sp.]